MKTFSYLPLLLALVLASCGTASDHFKIDGRFLNLNQGEFYVYSHDGAITGIDTIRVEGGRFTYEIACSQPSMLIIVFPNFSEQPIFAEPGASVEVSGDASHLKMMKVEGTDDNELMTQFREMTAGSSPPDTKKIADQFINDHPASPVSVYLVLKYFIQTANADYSRALTLINKMRKEQPDNGLLVRLQSSISALANNKMRQPLPQFSAKDTEGRTVSNRDVANGTAVINVWASWNYDSQKMQRMLRRMKKQKGDRLKLLSICLDAGLYECERNMKRDSISWPNICDGLLFESPVARRLAITTVPDNFFLRNGQVIERRLSVEEMEKKLKDI